MRDFCFFINLSISSQSQAFSFPVEDFKRKIVELGGENCINNGKNLVDYSKV